MLIAGGAILPFSAFWSTVQRLLPAAFAAPWKSYPNRGVCFPNPCTCICFAMETIAWTGSNGEELTGRIEAHVLRFVELIGIDATADLLLRLGGSSINIPVQVKSPASLIASVIGLENANKIAAAWPRPMMRIPIGNKFLSRYLRGKGHSVNDIARRLRCTDATVHALLKSDQAIRARLVEMSDRRRAEA